MTLSDMTAGEVVFALSGTGHADARREGAARIISELTGIPRGRDHPDARDMLDKWFEGDGIQDGGGALADATVHRSTAEAAADVVTTARLRALALCSDACGGVASLDIGRPMQDERQVSASPEGDGYRFMVPLSRDVYTDGWRILVREGALPDTVVTAMAGREAVTIADHPTLRGRLVAGMEEAPGPFRAIALDRPRLERWGSFA